MRLLSSLLALALTACSVPTIDSVVICHNANCSGTDDYVDDTLEALQSSLALELDGKPSFDGMELDTYLYFDGAKSTCLFAHDTNDLGEASDPMDAAALIANHLQKDVATFSTDRFYLKLELKPYVFGTTEFHTSRQEQQHAACALEMAKAAVEGSRHPVTIVFDSMSECLLDELQYQLADPAWQSLANNSNVDILYSAQVVPARSCIPAHTDIRSINIREWHSQAIDSIRPFSVWLDGHSENTETMKIMRHLNPEYISTSNVPFVRGYIEGFR